MRRILVMLSVLAIWCVSPSDAWPQFARDEDYEKNAPKQVTVEKTLAGHAVRVVARLKKWDLRSQNGR